MDLGATIGLVTAGTGFVSAIGFAVYALVLRNRLSRAQTGTMVAIGKTKLAESLALTEATKAAHAEAELERVRKQLAQAHLDKGALYERLAKAGVLGAADAVDDRIGELYAHEGGGAAGGGDDRPVPDRGAAAAAEAGADDLSHVHPPTKRTGDLL